jgi:hypothetical protein
MLSQSKLHISYVIKKAQRLKFEIYFKSLDTEIYLRLYVHESD